MTRGKQSFATYDTSSRGSSSTLARTNGATELQGCRHETSQAILPPNVEGESQTETVPIPPQSSIPTQQGIARPISSNISALIQVPEKPNLYISWNYSESDRSIFPAQIVARRERLYNDLLASNTLAKLCKKSPTKIIYTLDLFLGGHVTAPGQVEVKLLPTIWIRCGRRVREAMSKALAEPHLIWVGPLGIGNVEILPTLRNRSRRHCLRIDGLDLGGGFSFGDSYRMHLHVQEPTAGSSICGLACCTTITHGGAVVDQTLSRIGGLLELRGSVSAVSTAHGMLGYLLNNQFVLDDLAASADCSDRDDDYSNESESGMSTPSLPKCSDTSNPEVSFIGSLDLQTITGWKRIDSALRLDFIGQVAQPSYGENWKFNGSQSAHDFALFDITINGDNSYIKNSKKTFVVGYLDNQYLPTSPQKVHILVSQQSAPEGRIIPGDSTLFIGGVEFETKRVILEHPLAAGTSGSWVVSGESLCGMIVAGDDILPIAQMITAEKLFDHIRSAQLTSVGIPILTTEESAIDMLRADDSVNLNSKIRGGLTPLLWAVKNRRKDIVNMLIAKNSIDLNSKDNGGRTPLFLAIENEFDDVVELLLATGKVDVNIKGINGLTLLLWAVENRRRDIVDTLIAKDSIDLNAKDNRGRMPLSLAFEIEYNAVIESLLATGNVDNIYGQILLFSAAKNGHEEVVKLLLATGKVEVDLIDKEGSTPLLWAAKNGHEEVVKLLLATGKVEINLIDKGGSTPLLWAAKNGHEEVVKLLLATGKVEVDLIDKEGLTPLLWAAENGHEEVVKLLLATGKVEINLIDKGGSTPLLWASEKGHENIVKLLLDIGKADVGVKDIKYGQTPLLWAAKNGHEGIVKLLLDVGQVDINTKDKNGRTPLLWAAKNGHERIVQLLLDTGKVDVDIKDTNCIQTPLSWAAENGHKRVVELLLATGMADVNAKDDFLRTPISWAAENGHEEVVKLLLATGIVNIDTKDKDGRTTLSRAAYKGHTTIVKLLEQVNQKLGFRTE